MEVESINEIPIHLPKPKRNDLVDFSKYLQNSSTIQKININNFIETNHR